MSYDVVPESAPFSAEQRAWLNGFFAGILGTLDVSQAQGGSAESLAAAAAMLSPVAAPSIAAASELSNASASQAESEEDFPWSDPSLPSAERMALASDRPLPQRMMAAMGQLNCGSCGYLCKTYAEAIASGTEKNLTLCSPGGTDTVKLLRQLSKERGESARTPTALALEVVHTSAAKETDASSAEAAASARPQQVSAKLISSTKLNGEGSAKDTRHVAIDLGGTGLKYRVGDALGILPTNCPSLVRSVCHAAGLEPQMTISVHGATSTLQDALGQRCLRSIPLELCQRAAERVGKRPKFNGAVATDAALVQRLTEFPDSDDFYEFDVCEFLLQFGPLDLTPLDLVETLAPLRPRLYSIASSQSQTPDQVHLTVGRVEEVIRDRHRKGVASTMLADRLEPGAAVEVFVQPSHGFTVPDDPSAPMIMVGPGTGIAPFIAFLQQRACDRATGKNWLFFGDQKRECDFLYRDQLTAWQASGLLTRLDLAFSRDDRQKVYVQHRMREHSAEIFQWLESGSYFFVCGDARRMARDVEQTLVDIIAEQRGLSLEAAKAYVAQLKQSKRYVCDVY